MRFHIHENGMDILTSCHTNHLNWPSLVWRHKTVYSKQSNQERGFQHSFWHCYVWVQFEENVMKDSKPCRRQMCSSIGSSLCQPTCNPKLGARLCTLALQLSAPNMHSLMSHCSAQLIQLGVGGRYLSRKWRQNCGLVIHRK